MFCFVFLFIDIRLQVNISAPPTEFGYPTSAEFAMKATMLKKLAEDKTTPGAPHQTEIQKTIKSVQQ